MPETMDRSTVVEKGRDFCGFVLENTAFRDRNNVPGLTIVKITDEIVGSYDESTTDTKPTKYMSEAYRNRAGEIRNFVGVEITSVAQNFEPVGIYLGTSNNLVRSGTTLLLEDLQPELSYRSIGVIGRTLLRNTEIPKLEEQELVVRGFLAIFQDRLTASGHNASKFKLSRMKSYARRDTQ